MDIKIRKADINDLASIQELNNELFKKEYEEYDDSLKIGWSLDKDGKEYFTELINNQYVLIATNNEEIIGYLAGSIHIPTSYNITDIAVLENMYIKEKYRNCGIGKKLIQNFIDYCYKNKIDEIRVTASFKNNNAIQFYMKNGFEEFELTLRKKQ